MNVRERIAQLAVAFARRSVFGVQGAVLENPTEEIEEAIRSGKQLVLYGANANGGRKKGVRGRLEENFLFDTRRFPAAVDNVLPAAPHLQGQPLFFANAVGGNGANNGFPSGFQMSELETNMDVPSQVPYGKDFVLHQLGVSFNAEATADDIMQALDAGALRFQKQGVQFSLRHGPAQFWPGGQGVSGFTALQGSEAAHNGVADHRSARFLRVPRIIKALENFSYVYDVPRTTRATTGVEWLLSEFIEMRLWLWGGQRDSIPV